MNNQCPCGRTKICGTIVAVKPVAQLVGFGAKIVVRDDQGFNVCGKLPNELRHIVGWKYDSFVDEAFPFLKASNFKVEFEAVVIPDPSNDQFGFFKHPANLVSL